MNELLRVLLGWQRGAKDVSDTLNTPEDIQRGKDAHAAKVAAQRAAAKRRAEEDRKRIEAEKENPPASPKKSWYQVGLYDLWGKKK
ncbi:MAG TPA: hypothetical protein VMX15_00195 [Candidatus Heimdallarchaeota archaeon]|nr:hypothetical protein [Candidatus Heimdallarchaeota archaeon]